uniref:Testis-expressed sequence 9 protein n=1 Tax=Lygus hesperus TaxID=30085 RepID=A0A0A9Z1F9_LYGHE
MDSGSELLEQEEELHRMNADLELRTRKLLEDVQKTVTRQAVPSAWSNHALFAAIDEIYNEEQRETRCSRARSACSRVSRVTSRPASQRRPFTPERTFSRKELESEDILPPGSKNMSAESQVRFLKAKCKILQEDIAAGKREYSIRTDEWRKVQSELKVSEEERLKLAADLVQTREKLKKQEVLTVAANERLTLRDNEATLLRKEVEMLKQDLKKIGLTTSANDAKVNKIKEELERTRQLLKKSQLNEKEAKEKARATEEEMYLSVRKLERQKSDLVGAIRKQIYLIDNLKATKGHLEAEALAKLSERDFLALLDWKPPVLDSK